MREVIGVGHALEDERNEYPTRAVYDEVRIHQTRVPEPMRAPEAQAGFLTSLDRFAAYLAGLAGTT